VRIVWRNCADEMPLNNHDIKLIAKGAVIREVNAGFLHWRIPHYERHKIEWTEYTKEKWDYLNDR